MGTQRKKTIRSRYLEEEALRYRGLSDVEIHMFLHEYESNIMRSPFDNPEVQLDRLEVNDTDAPIIMAIFHYAMYIKASVQFIPNKYQTAICVKFFRNAEEQKQKWCNSLEELHEFSYLCKELHDNRKDCLAK